MRNPSTIKTSWKTFIRSFQSGWTRFYYQSLNIFRTKICAAQEKVVFAAVLKTTSQDQWQKNPEAIHFSITLDVSNREYEKF